MITLLPTARNDVLKQLQAVGCPMYLAAPINQKEEHIVLAEATPFLESGETFSSVIAHFELLAYPTPSLDPVQQLRYLDDLTGRIMAALWETTDIRCEGYTNVALADSTPRFIARFTVSTTYTIEKES